LQRDDPQRTGSGRAKREQKVRATSLRWGRRHGDDRQQD
jgi:hypothetical protein